MLLSMASKEKLLARLMRRPRDFSWHELERLLDRLGYTQVKQGKAGGSRRRFVHKNHPTISLHKPHPGNILKRYQVDQIIALLVQEKLL